MTLLLPRRGVWTGLRAAWLVAGLWLLAAAGAVMAQSVLPVPPLSGRVIDQTSTLSAAQQAALDSKLAALEAETGSQVVVLIVASTAPEDIAAYAQRVADQWKIGRAAEGDGLLIVSSQGDRRLRIEVAKALEGAIPDLAARRLIDQQLTPAFRQGDFAGGFNLAVDRIAELIRAEKLPAPAGAADATKPKADTGMDWEALAMFFFIGVPVVGGLLTAVLGRRLGSLITGGAAAGLGWWLTASLVLAGIAALVAVVLVGVLGIGASRPGGGRGGRRGGGPPVIWTGGGGGWGGGSGGGGGFSSGGGGDFGGGGASGSW